MTSYDDKAERTRDFYRRQGDDRTRLAIIQALHAIREERFKAANGGYYSQTISFDEAIALAWDTTEPLVLAEPQDFNDPDAYRLITNRDYLRHLENAHSAGEDDKTELVVKILEKLLDNYAVTADDVSILNHALTMIAGENA